MNISNRMSLIIVGTLALLLGGCASPTIVLTPTFPPPASSAVAVDQGTVQLVVDGTANAPQLSRYEERGEKTLIGSSESLGVHLSDFWVAEAPPRLIERMLQINLKAWGYRVTGQPQPIQLHAHINRFSLNSRAISLIEFQADGVIDLSLEVLKSGKSTYQGHYLGTCQFKTATQIPAQDNMDRLFNECLAKVQMQLDGDAGLRAALSSH